MNLLRSSLFLCFIFFISAHSSGVSPRISNAIHEFIQNSLKSPSYSSNAMEFYGIKADEIPEGEFCATCRRIMNDIIAYRKSGAGREEMLKLVIDLCLNYTINGEELCNGYGNIEIDTIIYILDRAPDLTSDGVCQLHLQWLNCQYPGSFDWYVNIPPGQSIGPNQTPSLTTEKIVQVTDIHLDPNYKPGSNAMCDSWLCCQDGVPDKPENAAGYWGSYKLCNTPWHAFVNLLDQVTKEHPDIAYVYFTGDIMWHQSWAFSGPQYVEQIPKVFKLLDEKFPNVPVFPILGNHDTHPTDFFSPSHITGNVSTQWVSDLVANEWARWLPQDALDTVRYGGYYTVLVKKGFRIVALNSNVCYTENMWLSYNDVDPFGQLQWLAYTLAAAERDGESVHILSHIPPGETNLWRKCGHQFNKIIRRFSKTVKVQINGHTHLDEFRVFYDENKFNAVNVAFNGGSFSTFVGKNPNYRVFDMDSGNFEITDFETWSYNLTLANERGEAPPPWKKLYSFKEAYGLRSLSLLDIFDLVERMKHAGPRTLLEKYFRFQGRESDPLMGNGCDDRCLDRLLCLIQSVDYEDVAWCNKIQ